MWLRQNLMSHIPAWPHLKKILMESLNRHIGDDTRILFGAAVDPRMGQKMSVTILSALEAQAPAAAAPRPAPRSVEAAPAPVERKPEWETEEPAAAKIEYADSDDSVTVPEPVLIPAEPEPARVAASAAKPKRTETKQEQMQFEPVARGRFEKSEPTIVDGQNLDVPTFMRRNVKVK